MIRTKNVVPSLCMLHVSSGESKNPKSKRSGGEAGPWGGPQSGMLQDKFKDKDIDKASPWGAYSQVGYKTPQECIVTDLYDNSAFGAAH